MPEHPIQLLYVENVISRHRRESEQRLDFLMVVEHLAFEKEVEVYWAGEDGVWRVLKAEYNRPAGKSREIWRASAAFHLKKDGWLPGDIQFALRYKVRGKEYWDNNQGRNHSINADSGIRVADPFPLMNLDIASMLQEGQKSYPVAVAVRQSLRPANVHVRWTTDQWRSVNQTRCLCNRKRRGKALGGKARNPNCGDCAIWSARLKIDDAFRLEYALGAETASGIVWDNNFGNNYIAMRQGLRIMTLNLHCYQEKDQLAKFYRIAEAINDFNVDIVCLQEVAEPWNDGQGDWRVNAAKIIRERLARPYHLHTDWSHIGFDRYREGVAILSKHAFVRKDSRYVSASRDPGDIHARRVVMAQIHVPGVGPVNVFSAHLSWPSGGFREQFENLRSWAAERHADNVAATFLCGDFNIKAGSECYQLVADSREYEDPFLKVCAPEVADKLFGLRRQLSASYFAKDDRIDYIFMRKGAVVKPTSTKVLFTENCYGRVSDHCGYLVEFEPES